MKHAARAILVFALSSAALAQEPSAKDLRTALHAEVKQYANDGHLVASWGLRKPDELNAFEIGEPDSVKLEAEGLCFFGGADKEAYCTFKELEFQQPCRITFEVRIDGPESMCCVSLGDPVNTDDRMIVGMNMRGRPDSPTRYELIGRLKNAAPDGKPSTSPSTVSPKTWTPVAVDWKKDRLALSFGKTERCVLSDALCKKFSIAFVVGEGKAMIRNLVVDSQVDRDSVRKLFRSVAASETSRPGAESQPDAEDAAWVKLDEEMHAAPMDAAALADLKSLPSAAREAIDEGMKLMGKGDPLTSQARAKFDRAIQLAPKSGVALWLRGLIAEELGEGGRAVEFLEKAVATNPSLQNAWISLGKTRADRAQPEKAIEALAKAESLDPKDPWVHVARARIHLEAMRLEDARKEIARGLAKKPESEGLKLLTSQLARLTSRPDWKTSFKKENGLFVVETSISSKVAADLAQRLLIYRHFLEEKFPLPAKQATTSRVWVFDSAKEYHLFAALSAEDVDQSVGVYNPLNKTLMLTSNVSAEATQHTIFHEAFHQYLDIAVSEPPIWVNEGLAEYYGATTFDVSNRATEGGIVHDRIPSLKHDRLVPVADLLAMTHESFMNPKTAELHYAESWALVHFFKQGGNPAYARLFAEYCAAVIMHKSQMDAFDTTFGRAGAPPIETIDREFRSYVSNQLLKAR